MARKEGHRLQTCSAGGTGAKLGVQYGALCWRMHRDRVEVLLITSRDTGRWVIPKGWPMDGLSPEAAAAREAWEEAGVRGGPDPVCAGIYTYDKILPRDRAVPCAVAVYGLHVTGLDDRYPERKERRRKWFAAGKAARLVAEPELRDILLSFQPPPPPCRRAPIAADPDDELPVDVPTDIETPEAGSAAPVTGTGTGWHPAATD